jgi:serine/threonine-protein kinase
MSPEQATGDTVDRRSDVYGLGCVLYEMLAGELPFAGETAQAVLARKLSEPPRPLRTVRPDVAPAVERAVLRALEHEPARRPATAGLLAQMLIR